MLASPLQEEVQRHDILLSLWEFMQVSPGQTLGHIFTCILRAAMGRSIVTRYYHLLKALCVKDLESFWQEIATRKRRYGLQLILINHYVTEDFYRGRLSHMQASISATFVIPVPTPI